jgi:hypothetical protein
MFALVSYPDGTPIVLAGPCWPFCVGVTLPLILGVAALVSYFLVINSDKGMVRAPLLWNIKAMCVVWYRFQHYASQSYHILSVYNYFSQRGSFISIIQPLVLFCFLSVVFRVETQVSWSVWRTRRQDKAAGSGTNKSEAFARPVLCIVESAVC